MRCVIGDYVKLNSSAKEKFNKQMSLRKAVRWTLYGRISNIVSNNIIRLYTIIPTNENGEDLKSPEMIITQYELNEYYDLSISYRLKKFINKMEADQ